MLKTLLAEVKQYKKASILTPAFMVGEVVMEILIPMLMVYLIDSGVEKGDVRTICITGGAMAVMAMLSLACGVLSGKYGARPPADSRTICASPCSAISRHFLFPTSTNTPRPGSSPA